VKSIRAVQCWRQTAPGAACERGRMTGITQDGLA
jgi:hypothetical protein